MIPITTKDESKTVLTKDENKIVVLYGSVMYDGKLYIYQSGEWIPRPLLVADPFDRRPVYFRKDGEWHLTQSF